jgi:hypothetical protein
MARIPNTRTLALRVARDPRMSMRTRLEAALTAKPYLSDEKFARLLRLLIAARRRGPVTKECLRLLQEVETTIRKRGEADRVLAEESRRMQLRKKEAQ